MYSVVVFVNCPSKTLQIIVTMRIYLKSNVSLTEQLSDRSCKQTCRHRYNTRRWKV